MDWPAIHELAALSPPLLLLVAGAGIACYAVRAFDDRYLRRRWLRIGLAMVVLGVLLNVAYDLGLRDAARTYILEISP